MTGERRKQQRLGDCVTFLSGGTPSKANVAYWGGDIPWVSFKDMKTERIFDAEDHVSEKGLANGTRLIRQGTVLIVVRGMILAKEFPVAVAMREVTFNQDLKALKCSPILDDRFLFYWLKSKTYEILGLADEAAHGTKRLQTDRLQSLEINIPPKRIQKAITSILSAYDDLIENNTRRIKILEEMAKMIFREWFVNFRFPGREKVEIVESESGPIPQGWGFEPLGEHLSVVETGNRPKGGVGSFSEGVPSLGAESITGIGRFDYAKTKYVPIEYFQKMKLGILQDRDVLVYKDGGQPGNFHPHISLVGNGFLFSRMVINSHVYRLRTTDRITQDFLYYHLSSDESLNWMRKNGTGSAIPGLARKDLLRLPIILPPITLIRQFDRFAKPLNSMILLTARRIRNLITTRNLMLPKLISGEVSVEQVQSEAVAQSV